MKTVFSILGAIAVAGSSASATLAYENTNHLQRGRAAMPKGLIMPGDKTTPWSPVSRTPNPLFDPHDFATWGIRQKLLIDQQYINYVNKWYNKKVGKVQWFDWCLTGEKAALQSIMQQIAPGIVPADYFFYHTLAHGDGLHTDVKKILADGLTITFEATGKDHYKNTVNVPIKYNLPWYPLFIKATKLRPAKPVPYPYPWPGPHFPNTNPWGPTGNQDHIAVKKLSGLNNFELFLDISKPSINWVNGHYINGKHDKAAYAIYDFVTDAYPACFSIQMLHKMKAAGDPSISTIFQPLAKYIGYTNPKDPSSLLKIASGFLDIHFNISFVGAMDVTSYTAGANHRF